MEERRSSREIRILRSQSRWLQKALFALSKAEDDRERLADLGGESLGARKVKINGRSASIDAVTDALGDAVHQWLEEQRAGRRREHAMSG